MREVDDGIVLKKRMVETGILFNMMLQDYHKALVPLIIEHEAEVRLKQMEAA